MCVDCNERITLRGQSDLLMEKLARVAKAVIAVDLFGNIAQRWCRYRKAGVLDGVAFEAEGWKSLQCVRTPQGWRIASVAWDDQP